MAETLSNQSIYIKALEQECTVDLPTELDAARHAAREAESEAQALSAERSSLGVALAEAEATIERLETEHANAGSARVNLEARMEQWERLFEENAKRLDSSEDARAAQAARLEQVEDEAGTIRGENEALRRCVG